MDKIDKKIENIKRKLAELKEKLDLMEDTLDNQEKIIDKLDESTSHKLDFKNKQNIISEEVLKVAFPSGKIPKILSEG